MITKKKINFKILFWKNTKQMKTMLVSIYNNTNQFKNLNMLDKSFIELSRDQVLKNSLNIKNNDPIFNSINELVDKTNQSISIINEVKTQTEDKIMNIFDIYHYLISKNPEILKSRLKIYNHSKSNYESFEENKLYINSLIKVINNHFKIGLDINLHDISSILLQNHINYLNLNNTDVNFYSTLTHAKKSKTYQIIKQSENIDFNNLSAWTKNIKIEVQDNEFLSNNDLFGQNRIQYLNPNQIWDFSKSITKEEILNQIPISKINNTQNLNKLTDLGYNKFFENLSKNCLNYKPNNSLAVIEESNKEDMFNLLLQIKNNTFALTKFSIKFYLELKGISWC